MMSHLFESTVKEAKFITSKSRGWFKWWQTGTWQSWYPWYRGNIDDCSYFFIICIHCQVCWFTTSYYWLLQSYIDKGASKHTPGKTGELSNLPIGFLIECTNVPCHAYLSLSHRFTILSLAIQLWVMTYITQITFHVRFFSGTTFN